ncbi:unnamed protein product [Cylindrotheca closterium]|uniref:Uncharacterized protein n=1 Tax=Cylindrotheca closterium TaxID=2856 RepID=A0AAD2GB44_9STRA|nr:unnamed protein product [Cylindrotheca closterium]
MSRDSRVSNGLKVTATTTVTANDTITTTTNKSNSNSNSNNSNNNNNNKDESSYNPRWSGYVLLSVTSLINFLSIATLSKDDLERWGVDLVFGMMTFCFSTLVVLQDRSKLLCHGVFHKARKGFLEGVILMACLIWWSIGTAYQTNVNGIAYNANNIYYSAWASLLASGYLLNEWSSAKDILSVAELTGLSLTLPSWYTCWFFSIVVLFTSVDMLVYLEEQNLDDASFGIGLGFVSSVISAFFILVHYNFITSVEEGGWMELSSSFFLILLWTIGLALITQDRGIAATLSGTQCKFETASTNAVVILTDLLQLQREAEANDNELEDLEEDQVMDESLITTASFNCTISYNVWNADTTEMDMVLLPCSDVLAPARAAPKGVPGSNLYFAAWICFFSSLSVTFRWKAAQALQFAQAQQERQERQQQQKEQLQRQRDSAGFSDSDDGDEDDDEDQDTINC